MTDVFISYKRRMRSRVVAIANALESLGLEVWFDAALEPGRTFAAEISSEVRGAKCVLVLWTNDAFPHGGDRAGWVVGEATIGLERGVLVTASLEPTSLDPPWNTIHTESLAGWLPDDARSDRRAWGKVLAAIGQLVGRPGLADYDHSLYSEDRDHAIESWAILYPDDPLARNRESASTGSAERASSARAILTTRTYVAAAALVAIAVATLSLISNRPAELSPSSAALSSLVTQLEHPEATVPLDGSASSAALSMLAAMLSSPPPGVVDLGPENVSVLAKTTASGQSGLGRTERILTIARPTPLADLLAKNGFTKQMIAAIISTMKNVYPDPTLPARAHVRILFGASSTSDTLIPYRVSIYVHDDASNTEKHAATVALTDRGSYVLGLAPSEITLPDGLLMEPLAARADDPMSAPNRVNRSRPPNQ